MPSGSYVCNRRALWAYSGTVFGLLSLAAGGVRCFGTRGVAGLTLTDQLSNVPLLTGPQGKLGSLLIDLRQLITKPLLTYYPWFRGTRFVKLSESRRCWFDRLLHLFISRTHSSNHGMDLSAPLFLTRFSK